MLKEYMNKIVEWADKDGRTDFSDFVILMQQAYENGYRVKTQYGDEVIEGKLIYFYIAYDEKFPDMDITYQQKGCKHSLYFEEITKENIRKEDEIFHIINTQGCLDAYIEIDKE